MFLAFHWGQAMVIGHFFYTYIFSSVFLFTSSSSTPESDIESNLNQTRVLKVSSKLIREIKMCLCNRRLDIELECHCEECVCVRWSADFQLKKPIRHQIHSIDGSEIDLLRFLILSLSLVYYVQLYLPQKICVRNGIFLWIHQNQFVVVNCPARELKDDLTHCKGYRAPLTIWRKLLT